jgi:hypothetical protein
LLNLFKWADHEVCGVSPLAFRLYEVRLILEELDRTNRLDFARDLIDEYRAGLEEMERKRLERTSMKSSGSKVSRDPNYIRLKRLLATAEIPDGLREWAVNHTIEGEKYAEA